MGDIYQLLSGNQSQSISYKGRASGGFFMPILGILEESVATFLDFKR